MNLSKCTISGFFALLLATTACSQNPPDINWDTADNCTLKLVAYKTSKASYYWMEEVETKAIYKFHSLGGRRMPTIALGMVLPSKCAFVGSNRYTQFEQYKKTIVENPQTGSTATETLSGYDWVLKVS
jgi:hypothetical protein